MPNRDKDIKDILTHYVNRQSPDEIEFIIEQEKSGIKVCDRLSHQLSRDGKDELVIESQLSSTNISSESSGDRACVLIKTKNSCDHSGSSINNADYYIKELRIARATKSKSLDDDQMNRLSEIHETQITTVIGRKNKPFETVHKAVIGQLDSALPTVQKNSFVRETIERPSSSHSLPGRIFYSMSLPSSDKSSHTRRKKSTKFKDLKSWWQKFLGHKKNKKSHSDLSEIDKLAKQSVFPELKEVKVESKSVESSLFSQLEKPFKSYKIGEPLEPINKKKGTHHFLQRMLHPSHSLPRNAVLTSKATIDNNNIGSHPLKEYSTPEMVPGAVTTIVAIISTDKDEEDFSYRTNEPMEDSRDQTGVRQRYQSGPANVSKLYFDMQLSGPRTRRSSYPGKSCDCDNQRRDLMAKVLDTVIYRTSKQEIRRQLKGFDNDTSHFKDCPFNNVEFSLRRDSRSSVTQSRLSLYQSCEYCDNVDDQLHPEISVHLLPMIMNLEDNDEINFNDDHLRYFLDVKCYKEFEKGMCQTIGPEGSIRNLAYLHYVTKKIVRHIGDPSLGDNEHIRRIMHYAQKFCIEQYNEHIEMHGSLEAFLKHHILSDVD